MPKHIKDPFDRFGSLCDNDPGGVRPEEMDFGWCRTFAECTCHHCLEVIVRLGEGAVARIVELDKTAAEVGNPEGSLFVDCDCGATWHHRNNIPCQRKRIQEARGLDYK